MSKYEKFSSERGRKDALPGLAVRPAVPADAEAIASIIAERSGAAAEKAAEKVRREFETQGPGAAKLFVAVSEGGIAGFCRCGRRDTAAQPFKFPAPAGWYCLGLVVRGAFRGRGVARALYSFLGRWLRETAGTDRLYSFCSAENAVSLKMHAAMGFEAVSEGPGFLDVPFDCGRGVLFRLELPGPGFDLNLTRA